MENNNRYSKYVAIIALLISVVGVSLGFAAYSNTVQIKARADVDYANPNYQGGVLSTDPDDVEEGTVTPTTTGGATADPANLTETGIENIHVYFTDTNQSATYSFYGINKSAWVSYLNSVTFGSKTCTPGTGTNADYVAEACNDIIMTISVSSDSYPETEADISGHELASGNSEPIAVTIEYLDGGNVADGPFEVNFGTSSLVYGSAE